MLASILFALGLASAAPVDYPTLPAHVQAVEQLVPPGWSVETRASGILDEGRRPAVALVLHATSAQAAPDYPETAPRLLVVAVRGAEGGYDVALQNHTLMPQLTADDLKFHGYDLGRRAQGGGEVPGLDFHKGTLRVRLYEWCTCHIPDDDRTYTFRLQGGKFMWIGYDSQVVNSHLESAAWSIDFLTRKISLTSGESCAGRADVLKHCRWKEDWAALKPGPLQSIEEVGSGLSFEPQLLWPENQ